MSEVNAVFIVGPVMKKCSGECGLEKEISLDNFAWRKDTNKFSGRCKICTKNKKRKYYLNNKKHLDDCQQKWLENNKDKDRLTKRKYKRNRRKTDYKFKLRSDVSSLINKHLKQRNTSKIKSTNKILPYTFEELEDHLESLFEPWMNWENKSVYNKKTWKDDDSSTWTWNLDHIIPQSMFNYINEDDEGFQKCWDLSNIRPYSAKQNLLDGVNKIRHQ